MTNLFKKSNQRAANSGEMDVFQATRYFSGTSQNTNQNVIIQDINRRNQVLRLAARTSLDAILRNPNIPADNRPAPKDEKKIKERKKQKHPRSPGGRLASFLNSLFSQTSLKKRKPKSAACGGNNLPSAGAESGRGFGHFFCPTTLQDAFYAERREEEDEYGWEVGFMSFKNAAAMDCWIDDRECHPLEEMRLKKLFNDHDEGSDTDSSSDLFDLPNHELDLYANGLPVYETTRMNSVITSAREV